MQIPQASGLGPKTNNDFFLEIRFFSRGGQGGVSAAELLAFAGMLQGFETQAIPKYGAERKGAPLFADLRLSNGPIRRHAPVVMSDADQFIILEETLLEKLPSRFTRPVIVIVNTSTPPSDYRPINAHIGYVDAYKIADETNLIKSGTRLVSSIMLGAWSKATSTISLENIEKAIVKKFSGATAEQNLKAVRLAFDRFQFVS